MVEITEKSKHVLRWLYTYSRAVSVLTGSFIAIFALLMGHLWLAGILSSIVFIGSMISIANIFSPSLSKALIILSLLLVSSGVGLLIWHPFFMQIGYYILALVIVFPMVAVGSYVAYHFNGSIMHGHHEKPDEQQLKTSYNDHRSFFTGFYTGYSCVYFVNDVLMMIALMTFIYSLCHLASFELVFAIPVWSVLALTCAYFLFMAPFRLFTDIHESRRSTLKNLGIQSIKRGDDRYHLVTGKIVYFKKLSILWLSLDIMIESLRQVIILFASLPWPALIWLFVTTPWCGIALVILFCAFMFLETFCFEAILAFSYHRAMSDFHELNNLNDEVISYGDEEKAEKKLITSYFAKHTWLATLLLFPVTYVAVIVSQGVHAIVDAFPWLVFIHFFIHSHTLALYLGYSVLGILVLINFFGNLFSEGKEALESLDLIRKNHSPLVFNLFQKGYRKINNMPISLEDSKNSIDSKNHA